jgi:hypothetical protein
MTTTLRPYTVGQRVRLLPSGPGNMGAGEYVIVRRNDIGTREPSYVIENVTDRRQQRREVHSRLERVGGAA